MATGAVLVAYATRNGSTQTVAEAVAATLRERGTEVDFRPARGPRTEVERFEMVVLGAPLYSGRWHRDAHRFLRRHRPELVGRKVAVFGMGPRENTPEAWARARGQLDHALAKHHWLVPAAVTVFGGVDPPKKKAARDLRDWPAIAAWAAQLTAGPTIAADLG